MKTFTVYSSHGELVANAETGDVVSRTRHDPNDPESAFIDDIVCFCMAASFGEGIAPPRDGADILNMAYMMVGGCVEPAVGFVPSMSHAAWCAQRVHGANQCTCPVAGEAVVIIETPPGYEPTVTVSAAALREVLAALSGFPHEIRELQVTRDLLGGTNPINRLVEEFNRQV